MNNLERFREVRVAMFNEWRAARLVDREGLETSSGMLYQDYRQWVDDTGRTPAGRPTWGEWMGEMYGKRRSYPSGVLITVYCGVGFKHKQAASAATDETEGEI